MLDESRKNLGLLRNEYVKTQDRALEGLQLMMRQRLDEIRKMGDWLMKAEDDDAAEEKTIVLQLNDVRKLKEKLERGIEALGNRVDIAAKDVGQD